MEFEEISIEVEELTPGAAQSFWQQAHGVYFRQMQQQAMGDSQQQPPKVETPSLTASTKASTEPTLSEVSISG